MTPEQIDALITVRNSITDICTDFATNTAAIDSVLAEIPAGVDNRVDLILGRPEAVLPERPGYILNPVVTLEQPETISALEQTRIIFEAAQDWQYLKGDCAL